MNRLNLIYHPTTHNATLSDTCVDASFTDEENASGFFNSKAQRERFAEYHDFPISHSSKQDSETGYHYFGARYYDSELLTGWLSVDPMADKYPGISPYAYCAWTRPTGGDEHRWIKYNTVNNPVKLLDPDGRDGISSFYLNTGNKDVKNSDGEPSPSAIEYIQNLYLYNWSQANNNPDNVLCIYGHGGLNHIRMSNSTNLCSDSQRDFIAFSPEMLVRMIMIQFPTYDEDQKIKQYDAVILFACHTGEDVNNGFAQQLSLLIPNTYIVAPGDNLSLYTNQQVVNSRISIGCYSDNLGNEYRISGGPWNIFRNGELIETKYGLDKGNRVIDYFSNPHRFCSLEEKNLDIKLYHNGYIEYPF